MNAQAAECDESLKGAFMPHRFCLSLLVFAQLGVFLLAADRPPNFVIIFADDLGYEDLGCFGSPDIRTPRLDAMAKAGMRFTSFYAQSICGPSRAAIMTGCYPMRVAERGTVKNVHPILHSDEITIAEVLKTRQYATACFGKWDLAKHAQKGFSPDLFPLHQGFDYFYGTPSSNDGVTNIYRNDELIEPKSDMSTLTKRYTDEALGFMQKHKDEPFFVYLPHTMPHTRLDASPDFKGKSKRGLYGDVIEEIDFNAGRILDAVQEMGLADNTYVLFTSDNGPWLIKNKNLADGHLPGDHGGSAGPLRSGKVSSFEGGLRVPTILWGPGRVPAGSTCDSLASTLDLMPTLAALAGTKAPQDRVIDGEDIRHLFHGEFDKANASKAFFYYLRVHLQAVRQGKWKLHLPRDAEPVGAAPFSKNGHIAPADRIGFPEPFLVNLDADIGEETNVAAAHPEVVERLLGLAESMREDLGDFDRVGKNMRFFDPVSPRPTVPPVPKPRAPKKKKKK
ncbi:MAG: arylsulfatase A-like enzyme [Rhodothermales bacterium]